MTEAEVLLWLVRTMEIVATALGIAIAYFAFRAYVRGNGRTFLISAIGFICITISSLIEDILHEIGRYALLEAQVVRATLDAVGFLLLIYSLTRTSEESITAVTEKEVAS